MSTQLNKVEDPAAMAETPDSDLKDVNSKSQEEKTIPAVKQSRGVTRMQAVARMAQEKRWTLYTIAGCIYACAFAYILDNSTTLNYSVWATSDFQQHSSGLASLSIATSIIAAVSKPFIAKLSDTFSRARVYVLILALYIIGYIIVVTSSTLSAYVVGQSFVAVAQSGVDLLNVVIVCGLVNLEYRGLATAMLATPYIYTVWFAGPIVQALSTGNKWRWGYLMWLIILPVVLIPAIGILLWLERAATRLPPISPEKADAAEVTSEEIDARSWMQRVKAILVEVDLFGLLLLGFGWSLLLLPFSLSTYARGGYNNPSLIAMFVVGALCLIAYVVYEVKWAPFPSAPRRLLTNKTLGICIIINFVYLFAGYMQLLYLSSYVYVVKDWSISQWTYFTNTLTVSLCFFGVVAGIIMRATHRFKLMQIVGIAIKCIGFGLLVQKSGVSSTARLVMSQLLTGLGGGFSVVASQVAVQASVPHQDVALSYALLSLWTSIGGSIGSAVASTVWAGNMPSQLRAHLPASVSDEQVQLFFSDITQIRDYPWSSEIRQGAIEAYQNTVFPLWAGGLGVSFVALIAACFQKSYYLGKSQNAYDNTGLDGGVVRENGERAEPATRLQRILRLFR